MDTTGGIIYCCKPRKNLFHYAKTGIILLASNNPSFPDDQEQPEKYAIRSDSIQPMIFTGLECYNLHSGVDIPSFVY